MSDTPQNDSFLSAFLDGELRQDQRELLEKRIANDPNLQALLQQWKEQGNAIRSIPKHELHGDLTQSVLSEIHRRRSTGELSDRPKVSLGGKRSAETELSKPSSNPWRTATIAIASLASMLLLGLFLFRPNFGAQQIASNADSKVAKQESVAASNEGTENAPAYATPEAELALTESDQSVEVEAEIKLESKETSNAPVGSSDAVKEYVLAEKSKSKKDPSPSVAGPVAVSDSPSNPKEELSEMQAHASPSVAEGEAMAGKMGGGMGPSPQVQQKAARQAVSIPQVYFVEFTSKEQPLAVVSEVFSRNQIEIHLPEGLETDSKKSAAEVLRKLATQSNQGLEAIYVVATRSQLRRAMAELSDSANISGFEVTSSILGKMLASNNSDDDPETESNEPSMKKMIEERKSQSQSQSSALLSIPKLDKGENKDSEKASTFRREPVPPRAMAQQLRPFVRQRRTTNTNSPQESLRRRDEQADSLDKLIESSPLEVNWNFSNPGPDRSSPSPNGLQDAELESDSREDSLKSANPDEKEELVQFLLLVRTNQPE